MSTLQKVAIMERLAWAHRHIEHAHNLANTCVDSDFYKLALEHVGKRRIVVRVDKANPYPREFSMMVGDAAHNIHAALDNLAFAVVKPQPGKEKKVYFPICKTKERFDDCAPRYLPGVSAEVRAIFESFQPYNSGQMPGTIHLAMLDALNNWDKHRELAVCVTVAGGITFFPIVTGPHKITSTTINPGIFKKGAILATFEFGDGEVDSDVEMNPQIKLAPVFDERMPIEVRNIPVIEVLRRTWWFVERTVVPALRGFI